MSNSAFLIWNSRLKFGAFRSDGDFEVPVGMALHWRHRGGGFALVAQVLPLCRKIRAWLAHVGATNGAYCLRKALSGLRANFPKLV